MFSIPPHLRVGGTVKKISLYIFIAPMRVLAAKNVPSAPDLEVRPIFVKYRYTPGRYTPTKKVVDLEKGIFSESFVYVTKSQQTFANNSFRASGKRGAVLC